jgi:hypothetical protein
VAREGEGESDADAGEAADDGDDVEIDQFGGLEDVDDSFNVLVLCDHFLDSGGVDLISVMMSFHLQPEGEGVQDLRVHRLIVGT